ncbi:cytochrome P450 71D9-like [Actinidia eriantha]|uniref:cytochrome P450 71D9-like n=1 Tax=Actinidia eriantha TaxID=165200 RepID=UPI0025901535|nr:cytochrome P450 71D9-like [Actinidia eriantha]XP_057485897.1 cytochrome P450 71D9-like [Actinidia eriantha]
MELQFPSFPILSTLFLFLFILLKTVIRSKTNKSTSNLPPGPWKLPIIGNLHQLASSLPHHALRDLAKKHGPLMSLQLGEVPAVVISSPETAKEVMKTHDVIFATRPHIIASRIMSYDSTSIAFAPYGEYWRQLRKICITELLSPKRVLSFRSIREEEVSKLIGWITSNAGSPINFTEKIYSSTYGTTSRAAFGKKFNEQEAFISIVQESTKIAGGFNIADIYPSAEWLHLITGTKSKLEKLHKEADRIMGNMINEHKVRREKGREYEDLVDALLQHHERGANEFSLTINNIKAVILDIFSAGSETSATTVDWAMVEMMKKPRIMKKAQAEVRTVFNGKGNVDETGLQELKYLKSIIKETLRLHPAAPLLLPRECGERCEIYGYEIPVKTKVIVNAWAIGRDPKHWTDAEEFIPERFLDSSIDYKGNNFEYIPFGAGRRICPGMVYGLANIEFPLAQILYHFDWKLPSGMKQEELDMTEEFGATVRRKEDLKVIPITYKQIQTEA